MVSVTHSPLSAAAPRTPRRELRHIPVNLPSADYRALLEHLQACEGGQGTGSKLLAYVLASKLMNTRPADDVHDTDLVVGGVRVSFTIDGSAPRSGLLLHHPGDEPPADAIPVASLLGATLIGLRAGRRAPLLFEDGRIGRLCVTGVSGLPRRPPPLPVNTRKITMSTTAQAVKNPTKKNPRIVISEESLAHLEGLADGMLRRHPALADRLYEELGRARIVAADKMPPNVVGMGSTVVFRDENTGQEKTVTLVYPEEADIARMRVSVTTPIGVALLGLAEGASFYWDTRENERRMLTVLSVAPPEAED